MIGCFHLDAVPTYLAIWHPSWAFAPLKSFNEFGSVTRLHWCGEAFSSSIRFRRCGLRVIRNRSLAKLRPNALLGCSAFEHGSKRFWYIRWLPRTCRSIPRSVRIMEHRHGGGLVLQSRSSGREEGEVGRKPGGSGVEQVSSAAVRGIVMLEL